MRAWFATISMILLALALAMASAATATAHTAPTATAAPLRGVWIPPPARTDFWRSPEDMKRHIAALHEAGINTICVVVWNQGRTFYKSCTQKELIGIEPDERMAAFAGEGGYNDSVKAASAFAHGGVAPPTNHKDRKSYEAELDKIVDRQVPKALHHKVHPGLLLRLADGYAAPIALVSAQVAANSRARVGGEVYFFNQGVMKNLTAIKVMYGRE